MKSAILLLGALSSINAVVLHLKLKDPQEPLKLDPVLYPEEHTPTQVAAQVKSKGPQEPLKMDPVLYPEEHTPT